MEIRFNNTDGWILTTQHPASHYGAGVLIHDKLDGVFAPGDNLPTDEKIKRYFGDCEYTAGEFIRHRAKEQIWSDAEIAFLRRYLSQDPQQRYSLPDDAELRGIQAVKHLDSVMGDTTQGVHEVYWQLGKAQVAVAMYEATEGHYITDDDLYIVTA